MTTADQDADPVWLFLQALPARIRRDLNRTEALVVLIHTATRDQGWTPTKLAERCAGGNTGTNPAGVVMYRLQHCATTPADTGHDAPARIPFCSPECRDNAGWVLDEIGMPAKKCTCRTPEVPA